MNNSKELRSPTYPVADFVQSSSSDSETWPMRQPGKELLLLDKRNKMQINSASEKIKAPAQTTSLATWLVAQSHHIPIDATPTDNQSPWWRKPICRNLSTIDVLFSVTFFGSIFGAIFALAKFI